jgi:hypothetical protein
LRLKSTVYVYTQSALIVDVRVVEKSYLDDGFSFGGLGDGRWSRGF